MKQHKFRGKRVDNGEWVYGVPCEFYRDTYRTNTIALINTIGTDELDGFMDQVDYELVDPNTIGQFTGLLDKNDVEIYERDILDSTRKSFGGVDLHYKGDEVKFERGAFRIRGYLITEHELYKVSGNIHDKEE